MLINVLKRQAKQKKKRWEVYELNIWATTKLQNDIFCYHLRTVYVQNLGVMALHTFLSVNLTNLSLFNVFLIPWSDMHLSNLSIYVIGVSLSPFSMSCALNIFQAIFRQIFLSVSKRSVHVFLFVFFIMSSLTTFMFFSAIYLKNISVTSNLLFTSE